MSQVRTHVTIRVHDTPSAIYNTLALVFPQKSGEMSRRIQIDTAEGIEITFFANNDEEVKDNA